MDFQLDRVQVWSCEIPDQPGGAAGILEPGERHWDILRCLVRDGQAAGPLVTDAVLAAIALEHGTTVCTTDRDFSRFSGLRWTNPLAENQFGT